MNPALVVLSAFFVIAVVLAMLSRRGHDMNLEQWSVGGRGFGSLFVFLLMAGEIYTTFTFLGGSGWAYGKGAPAFYILCYGAIAYSLSYFLLPVIWRYAQPRRLVSQADFFVAKYDSRALGILVSVVGVAALIPYLVLQLKGSGIIVSEASYGSIGPATAVWTGTVTLVGYVVVSGVRGSAWTAALKDVMILIVVVIIGIYLPVHYYGGYGADVPGDRAIEAGFSHAASQRHEPHLGDLHGAAHRDGLLHVAAVLRQRLHGAERGRVSPQRRDAAALSTRDPFRVLRRLRGDSRRAGTQGRRRGPVAVARLEADLWSVAGGRHRRGRAAHGARARIDDSHCRGDDRCAEHLSRRGAARRRSHSGHRGARPRAGRSLSSRR